MNEEKSVDISIEIDPLFSFHKLNSQGMEKAKRIAEIYSIIKKDLEYLCGDGREFSIVKTKLEEACFFSKKAMATKSENQE